MPLASPLGGSKTALRGDRQHAGTLKGKKAQAAWSSLSPAFGVTVSGPSFPEQSGLLMGDSGRSLCLLVPESSLSGGPDGVTIP